MLAFMLSTLHKISEKLLSQDFSSLALNGSFVLSLADLAAVTQNCGVFLPFTVETD
jgi:hypothetical protein